jgi:outer membrane protein assembly factor BamB
MLLTMGLVMGAFAGTIGTAGANDLEASEGVFLPWVPNGEMLDSMGPFYGTVTVQNLSSVAAIDLYFYAGVGSSSDAYEDPEVVANVQPNASVTLSAEQIGVDSPGGSVHVFGYTVEGGFDAPIAGSVKNVSPIASSDGKTNSGHITMDGYTGMTDEQVNTDDDTQILPIVQTNDGWDTKIRIASFAGEADPNPATAYTVTLYEAGSQGSAGPSSGEFTGLIRGGETVSIDIMDAPGIDEGWVGNAFITSNAPIGAIAERYKVETEMLLTNVSRPVINGGNGGPQTTSYAPLVFQNYNFWNTGISVANLDDNNSNTVTVSYFTPGGNQVGTEQLTIPPRGMEFVFTPGSQNLGLDGNVGSAVISGTTALQAVVDQVKYFGGDEEVGDAMSYVTEHDPATGGQTLGLPLVQKGNPNTGLGDTSGVQFFNPQPAASTDFEILVFDTTGNQVAPTLNTPLSFNLSGHQGVTVYTHNYSEMPAGFQGSLTASVGSGELTGVSNNVNYDVQNDGAAAYNLVKFTSRNVYSGGSDNEVHKIDSAGSNVWEYTGHGSTVRAVAVDPQGYVYSGGGSDEVHKTDPDGNVVWVYTGHTSTVRAVAVDADGYVYSGSNDNELHKINSDGNNVWEYTDHTSTVRGVAVDADGFVYSGSNDNSVHKIDSDGNNVWTYTEHTGTVWFVAVDTAGFVYSASADDTVHKIDPDGNNVWVYEGHGGTVEGVAVDPNGFVYSGARDNEVHKIDPDGNVVWVYTGHGSSSVRAVAVDPEGFVYSGASDNEVHKIDPDGNVVWVYEGHGSTIRAVAVDPGLYGAFPEEWN